MLFSFWSLRLLVICCYFVLVFPCFLSAVVRKGFGDAGLVMALLSVLTSSDQELLFYAARAISRMSYDSCK